MEHVTCPTKNGRDLEESIEHDNFYIILEYHAQYENNTYTQNLIISFCIWPLKYKFLALPLATGKMKLKSIVTL